MHDLLKILAKPDNVPIVLMIPATLVLLVMWWKVARSNDQRFEEGGLEAVRVSMEGVLPPEPEDGNEDDIGRVHTWPYLVRIELIVALAVMLLLTVWSILIDAPLEQLADPARTPNPSKAPWYFLGLQEMLVYFDAWIAGVVLPLLIIVGLAAIPYVDPNPHGNGYYCWKHRRFAISVFLFGYLILWIVLILVGVFCRGPGWNWFWPWQTWDPQLQVSSPSRNWSDLFGISEGRGAFIFGAMTMAMYYGLAGLYWFRNRVRLRALGFVRYGIVAFLFLTMMGLPIKVFLRLALTVKYVWVTPWFNI